MEASYSAVLLVAVLGLVLNVALWGHAQNVVIAAVQDGARVAAAQGGDLTHGSARAHELLVAGLGPSASVVTLTAKDEGPSVVFSARGEWSVVTGPGVDLGFPIGPVIRHYRPLIGPNSEPVNPGETGLLGNY